MKNKSKDIPYLNVRRDVIESTRPTFIDDSLRLFHEFITERYKVHIKKDVLKINPPYSDNPIMTDYKFCNVRREHDRSSRWLINNISNNPNESLNNRIYKSILYRLYNKPDTAQLIHLDRDNFFSDDNDRSIIMNMIDSNSNIETSYRYIIRQYSDLRYLKDCIKTNSKIYYDSATITKYSPLSNSSVVNNDTLLNKLTVDDIKGLTYYKVSCSLSESKFLIVNRDNIEKLLEFYECYVLNPFVLRCLTLLGTIDDNDYKFYTNAYKTGGTKSGIRNKYWRDYEIDINPRYLPVLLTLDLLKDNYADKLLSCDTALDVFYLLKSLPGNGNFIAYQLFVDLTYIDEFPFSENEFTVAGPGCYFGLQLLMKDKDVGFNGMTSEELLFWMRDHLHEEFERLNLEWNPDKLFSDLPKYDRCLNIMSLENCCCEFQKYWRLTNNKRSVRLARKYKPYQKEI